MKTVAEIQALLKNNGLYNGSIDSLVGNQTIKATQIAQQKGLLSLDDVNTVINFKNNDDGLKISQNFYLSELLKSETAVRFGINNTPSKEHKQHLIESTIYLWQPTRDLLKFPMIVSSGYRSRLLNNKVGGSNTSAHSHGYAIDFDCPSFGSTRQIASFLVNEFKARGIAFDQIILEYPDSHSSWIHLGYKQPNTNKQRNQVLTAVKVNGITKYISGLH